MEIQRHPEREAILIELFKSAPICITTGMGLHYNEEGQAVFTMPYNPGFDHALGGIHGGIIATMIDNAGWFTLAPHFDTWIATVEFQTRLLNHVSGEGLQAKGEIIRLGKRISIAEMEVRTSEGKLIAVGTGTFTNTSVPLEIPK